MIRTGEEYRESIRDSQVVFMNGGARCHNAPDVQAPGRYPRADL